MVLQCQSTVCSAKVPMNLCAALCEVVKCSVKLCAELWVGRVRAVTKYEVLCSIACSTNTVVVLCVVCITINQTMKLSAVHNQTMKL